jgi:hypothetical protein
MTYIMKKNFKVNLSSLVTTIVLALFSANCLAQALKDIGNKFEQYRQNSFQEKVFVHTDKNDYLAGEILWFKIYDVDGTYNNAFNLTRVAYVEIIGKGQIPVLQAKITMKDGSGNGSIYLPVSIGSGNYKIRAYTAWMKNFGADYYFEKDITIINPLKSPDVQTQPVAANYDAQFFPEGGDMVGGLTSKVAFRVVDQNGKGIDFKGGIINEHNDTVATFVPLKFGMGTFLFTPAAGSSYMAIIKIKGKQDVVKQLPAVMKQGYVMELWDDGSNQIKVTVHSNTGLTAAPVYLFIHTRQVVKYAESNALTNGTATFLIDKNKLGEGVSHLTVFNSDKQPVCERLYFKKAPQRLLIQAGTDQAEYLNRKKVNINIQAAGQDGKPLAAGLSMSVYRKDSLQRTDPAGIQSYLLLTSDLKGTIESPDYYLSDAPSVAEATDNLMLTQGWSRFKWNNVLTNHKEAFKFVPEFESHLVTGKITNIKTGEPGRGIMGYLSIPGKRIQFYNSKSDSTGNVLFSTKGFYGPSELIAQTNDTKDSLYRVEIANPFSDQFSRSPFPEFQFDKRFTNTLSTSSINMQVQNIYTGKARRFSYPLIDTGAFYGKPDNVYMLDNYTRFTTMEEVLREYVTQAIVGISDKKFRIRVLTIEGLKGGLIDNPLILFDGIPIFNVNKLMAIDPLKVKELDIMAQSYFYGPTISGGVFSFSTYKGDLGGVEIDPHAVVVDYEGLQLDREFFSPVYETEAQVNNRLPDFRSVLFWSPDVHTDGTGKTSLSFYTSDQTGNYTGVIQGITADGKPGMQTFNFSVKKGK